MVAPYYTWIDAPVVVVLELVAILHQCPDNMKAKPVRRYIVRELMDWYVLVWHGALRNTRAAASLRNP